MGIIVIIFSVILLIATAIYLYFKKSYSYFEKEGVPFIKPTFPFGNFQGIGSKYHFATILRKIYDEAKGKGKVVGFFNFIEPGYFITDIELVKLITVKNFNSFVNRGMFVNEENEPLTAHLVNIEDDRWRFMRNKLSPVFTSGKLRSMYAIINGLSENLIKATERQSKKSIEVKNLMTKFTVDVVSSTSFGMNANCLNDENKELHEISREIFGAEGASPMKLFFLFAFPELSKFLKLRQFSKRVTNFFINVISENIKYREDNNDNRSDFLNMLIQLKNKGSIDGEFSTETKKLTLNEILAQAFLFFFAGTDTSSTTASYGLTELAFHQDVQDKLRQEILAMTKDTNGEISYETLHEMTYLNQVVNETLRMHTPGFANLRKANEDFKVPGTNITIKKGYKVWIPTLAFHFEEKYWKNPSKFDPDRFTPEEIAKRPPMSYFPFGEGPRNCIGMRFGLINVKFAMATIIRNFKITPDPGMKYPLEIDPVVFQMEPKGGFMLKFEKI